MKKSLKKFLVNNRFAFAAFFLPVLILVLAFAVTGIYPFGDSQIAIIDMYHQYVPFLSELQHKLQTGGSLFYTWNGASGSNFWCLLAYYGASPLNLLLVLFPAKYIMEGITTVLLIKLGLAGSFMYIYLSKVQYTAPLSRRAANWQCVGFSCMYALSSYVMGYFWCIMWMDAVMLLPLCILGLNRLIEGRNPALYIITLALIIICNYYIGIIVCIFITVYYPVLYFIKTRGDGAKACALTTIKAVICSVMGVAISAFILLPTYISMQSTYYISSELPEDMLLYNDPLDILNQLLPASQLTFREGLPNLYCGMLSAILLAVFIVNRRIPLKEKLLNGALLVFMFFSLNVNVLNFMWHGFHFPNQLPFRFSFVVCFLLVGIACRSLSRINGIGTRVLTAILAAGCAYYLIVPKLITDKLDDTNVFFYLGIALLAAYCILIIVYRNGRIGAMAFSLILVLFVAGEFSLNTISSFEKTGNTTRSTYFENIEGIENLAKQLESKPFARAEINEGYTLNSPALYHYKGVSQFSSSISAAYTGCMEKIGLEGTPAKNRANYNMTDPVTNALLNIRYIITKDGPADDDDLTQVGQSGYSRLYENKYPLSVGYVLPDNIHLYDPYSLDPFTNLDEYVGYATDGKVNEVFDRVYDYTINASEMTATDDGFGEIDTTVDSTAAQGDVDITYTADKTCKYYVFVEADNAEAITIEREDDTKSIDVEEDSGSIINIGELEEGETFTVAVLFETGCEGSISSYVSTIDQKAWDEAYGYMSQNLMDVTDYSDRSIKGTVTADQDGVLVLSIPADKGWSLTVDGQERSTSNKIGDLWMSTSLTAGHHDIELKFTPPGIRLGFIISILAILALAAICVRRARRPQDR
ncbi:MAG: YfhO family protein [Bacillota bacterium]|nr:YfhO family protein [Bacillota bacterium]